MADDVPPEIADQLRKLEAATSVDPQFRAVGVATESARLNLLTSEHSSRVMMKAAREVSEAVRQGPTQPKWMIALIVVTAIASVVAAFGTVYQACK